MLTCTSAHAGSVNEASDTASMTSQDGFAGLRKLQELDMCGASTISDEEEEGTLGDLLQHLTRLALTGRELLCPVITSPTLLAVEVMCRETQDFPGEIWFPFRFKCSLRLTIQR